MPKIAGHCPNCHFGYRVHSNNLSSVACKKCGQSLRIAAAEKLLDVERSIAERHRQEGWPGVASAEAIAIDISGLEPMRVRGGREGCWVRSLYLVSVVTFFVGLGAASALLDQAGSNKTPYAPVGILAFALWGILTHFGAQHLRRRLAAAKWRSVNLPHLGLDLLAVHEALQSRSRTALTNVRLWAGVNWVLAAITGLLAFFVGSNDPSDFEWSETTMSISLLASLFVINASRLSAGQRFVGAAPGCFAAIIGYGGIGGLVLSFLFGRAGQELGGQIEVPWLLLGAFVLLLIGYALTGAATSLIANLLSTTAKDARSIDKRAPIVLVRSFADDDVRAVDAGGADLSTHADNAPSLKLEQSLAEITRPFGAFIAIGKPGTMRRDGAALSFHDDAEWQSAIEADFKAAAAVIAVAGFTTGLEWEMSTIRKQGYLNKTILLFPPWDGHHNARCEQVRRWLTGDNYGIHLMHADLTRACAVFWSSSQRPIIVSAYPAGVGAYEAAVEMALYSHTPASVGGV